MSAKSATATVKALDRQNKLQQEQQHEQNFTPDPLLVRSPYGSCLIIGRSGSGKSHLLRVAIPKIRDLQQQRYRRTATTNTQQRQSSSKKLTHFQRLRNELLQKRPVGRSQHQQQPPPSQQQKQRDDRQKKRVFKLVTVNVKSREYDMILGPRGQKQILKLDFKGLQNAPEFSTIILEDVISLTISEERTLRRVLNFNVHHRSQKLFVITHHVLKTSLWNSLPFYNYLIFTSISSNAPLVRRTLNYFNIEPDLLNAWVDKFSSFPQNQNTYFVFDCQRMIFSAVRGGVTDLISGERFETIGSAGVVGGAASASSTAAAAKSAEIAAEANKRLILQDRFDKFVKGQPERYSASAVFSIIIQCVSLKLVREYDLTLIFTTREKQQQQQHMSGIEHQRDGNKRASAGIERVSLVDYIDCLLAENMQPSNRIIFVHKFIKTSCRIPKIFIRNRYLANM